MHCPRGGPCTARDIPRPNVTPFASFDLFSTEFVKNETNNSWSSLAIETESTDSSSAELEQIFARGPNDVWLFVRKSMRTQILHSSAAPAKRKILPTSADARIALRNTREPAPWTGPCDQVYVRLGSDANAITKRLTEIHKALGAEATEGWSDFFEWALVP